MQLGSFGGRHLPALAATVLALCLPTAACTKSINVDNSGNPSTSAAGETGAGSGELKESGNPDDVGDDVIAVSGVVSDAETGAPIKGALVNTLVGQISTNGQGQYLFDVSGFPGLKDQAGGSEPLRITASKAGYQQDYVSILITNSHTRDADIVLARASDTHRFLLTPPMLAFEEDADFAGGSSASKQVGIKIDATGEESGQYNVNIPTTATWLTVGSGQNMGTATTSTTFVDFTVDKTDLKSGVT